MRMLKQKSLPAIQTLTLFDAIYICKFYEFDGLGRLAAGLGRSSFELNMIVDELKRNGDFTRLKSISSEQWLDCYEEKLMYIAR